MGVVHFYTDQDGTPLVPHLSAAAFRKQKSAEETENNYHASDFYLIYLTGFY